MIEQFYLLILIIISYTTGSIPTSIITGKYVRGIDIREHGSGNAGGTNVYRVLGWKPAIFVILVDIFKGWFPAAVLARIFFEIQPVPDFGVVQILCGFSAVLGHTYTIFAGFKGGKGVATYIGVLAGLSVWAVAVFALIWLAMAWLFRYSSLAALTASLAVPVIFYLQPESQNIAVISLVMTFIVFFKHLENIQRLWKGEEIKIGAT